MAQAISACVEMDVDFGGFDVGCYCRDDRIGHG